MEINDIEAGHFYQREDGSGLRVKVAQVRDTEGPEAKVFFGLMPVGQADSRWTELHTMTASRFAGLYCLEEPTADPEGEGGHGEEEEWGPGDLWAMESLAELDPCDQHALVRIAILMYSHYGDPHSVLSDGDVQAIRRSRELFVDEGIW
ncbi:hypothetical protein ACIBUR_38630 [Streptomyces anulatus]